MTQPPMTPGYTQQPAPQSGSGVATASLVLGIIAICVAAILFCFPYLGMFLGVLAIVLGVVAMNQGGTGSRAAGKGRTGMILGIIAMVIGLGWILAIRAGVSFLQRKGPEWQKQLQDKADEMKRQADEQQRKAEKQKKDQQNKPTTQPGTAVPQVLPWRVASSIGRLPEQTLLVTIG